MCGGGSSPPGLGLRLLRELRQMLPPSFSPGLIQAPEYAPSGTLKHSVFIGGAIVAKVAPLQMLLVCVFCFVRLLLCASSAILSDMH